MNWMDLADVRWKDLKKLDRHDILNRIGLEEHDPSSDVLTGLGLFAVGLLVGAGLGLIFAPATGTEMRTQLTDTLRKTASKAGLGTGTGMDTGTSTVSTTIPPTSTRIS